MPENVREVAVEAREGTVRADRRTIRVRLTEPPAAEDFDIPRRYILGVRLGPGPLPAHLEAVTLDVGCTTFFKADREDLEAAALGRLTRPGSAQDDDIFRGSTLRPLKYQHVDLVFHYSREYLDGLCERVTRPETLEHVEVDFEGGLVEVQDDAGEYHIGHRVCRESRETGRTVVEVIPRPVEVMTHKLIVSTSAEPRGVADFTHEYVDPSWEKVRFRPSKVPAVYLERLCKDFGLHTESTPDAWSLAAFGSLRWVQGEVACLVRNGVRYCRDGFAGKAVSFGGFE